eukprot:1158166-Pelagomonas_calceolata.AAC.2
MVEQARGTILKYQHSRARAQLVHAFQNGMHDLARFLVLFAAQKSKKVVTRPNSMQQRRIDHEQLLSLKN